MKYLGRKVASAVAVSSLLFNVFSSVALADTLDISGNGSDSTNATTITRTNTQSIVQNNDADISNYISSDANTGGNDANDNTGGNTVVATGNATNTIDVSTQVNLNRASELNSYINGDDTVSITGNGSDSRNFANIDNLDSNSVYQNNDADISNRIHADSNTGNNDANRNTDGDVTVITGHATTNITVSNMANANIEGSEAIDTVVADDTDSTADVMITGNGSDSFNDVDLLNSQSRLVVQDNEAYIRNCINTDSRTGSNYLNDNTGGAVLVDTGMASSTVDLINLGNLNLADTDSWFPSVLSTINGNGSDSRSFLNALFDDSYSIFQGDSDNEEDSTFDVNNFISVDPLSGFNDVNRNTDGIDGSMIITGHAVSLTTLRNEGNANLIGTTLPGGLQVNFQFDLGNILNSLFI